jgi:selenide,water dikinase
MSVVEPLTPSPVDVDIKLTALSHGGGCGCKIAPSVLREALHGISSGYLHPDLLVGNASSDDAAVFRLSDQQALVATTDFFMPIVDDPFDFGRIAATNALSDVYAMGAAPVLALAIVGMPVNTLPVAVMRRVMEGGAAVCESAHVALAGGHSIDTPEPIYGLAAVGVAPPTQIKRNDTARAGDVLVLGKPLGIGVLSTALKKGLLDATGYAELIATTTQLNAVGQQLGLRERVHAMTDVTGFGLLGHLLEICRGAGLAAVLDFSDVPVLPTAHTLVARNIGPGAVERNWQSYGDDVELDITLPDYAWRILSDPQTSGGLLVACDAREAPAVLGLFRKAGFGHASIIGRLAAGAPRVSVQ